MQENEADHVIKISRWLDACGRFMEASKVLTDYDIEGINRVIDIMKSLGTSDRIKSDIVRCGECANYCAYEDWDRYRQESFTSHECKLLKRDFGADGYCSLGRRNEAANETD